MGYYLIEPDPSTWEKQYEKFWVTIKAWDDNGRPCTMRNLELQYYMGVDGAAPDPYDTIRLYADADGLLTFQFNNPCRVTAYLVYSHDVNDETLGKNRELIADDLNVYFQPFITDINIKYTGNPVPIDNEFDPQYLTIDAKLNDNSHKTIPWSDIVFLNKTIYQLNDNVFQCTYWDDVLKITWTLYVTVPGTYKITKVWAEYVGDVKIENELVKKSEVKVYVEKFDGTNTFIYEPTEDEWSWVTLPYPNTSNNGKLKLELDGYICEVEVPYITVSGTDLKLDIWYEGPDIVIGHNYDIDNLRIRLVYANRNTRILNPEDIIITDYLVDHQGWCWFKGTFKPNSFITLSDWYCVYGYKIDEHEKPEFSVIWLDSDNEELRNSNGEEDVTSYYYNELKNDTTYAKSPVMIVWETIRKVAIDHKHYGRLRMTVPKHSGLGDHVASLWIINIHKDNREAINAVMVKQFNEVQSYDKKDPKERHVDRKCD